MFTNFSLCSEREIQMDVLKHLSQKSILLTRLLTSCTCRNRLSQTLHHSQTLTQTESIFTPIPSFTNAPCTVYSHYYSLLKLHSQWKPHIALPGQNLYHLVSGPFSHPSWHYRILRKRTILAQHQLQLLLIIQDISNGKFKWHFLTNQVRFWKDIFRLVDYFHN